MVNGVPVHYDEVCEFNTEHVFSELGPIGLAVEMGPISWSSPSGQGSPQTEITLL